MKGIIKEVIWIHNNNTFHLYLLMFHNKAYDITLCMKLNVLTVKTINSTTNSRLLPQQKNLALCRWQFSILYSFVLRVEK